MSPNGKLNTVRNCKLLIFSHWLKTDHNVYYRPKKVLSELTHVIQIVGIYTYKMLVNAL